MAKPFAVVKFPTEDDSVAVVPVVWLSPDWTECHWPVTRNSEITRLAKEQADPSAFPGYRWQMCQVAVVTTSRTYNSAEKKVTKYQYNSAVESSALSGNEYPDEAVRLPSPPPASPEHILSGDGDAENQEPAEEPAARSDTTATEHQTQLKVLRMLYEIRQQQRDSEHRVLQHQEAVLGRLASLEAAIAQAARSPEAEATVTNPKLPAYTLAELEAAEAAVKNDTVATALRKQLMRLGGGSLKEVASNIMTSIMGVEVQRLYSLHGRKGKKAFISMRLCRVATDAISEKLGVDASEAQGFIRRWLPGSCDRGGGRKRRFTDAFTPPTTVAPHADASAGASPCTVGPCMPSTPSTQPSPVAPSILAQAPSPVPPSTHS